MNRYACLITYKTLIGCREDNRDSFFFELCHFVIKELICLTEVTVIFCLIFSQKASQYFFSLTKIQTTGLNDLTSTLICYCYLYHTGFMGFKFFKRTNSTSQPQSRRRSFSFRRRSRHGREERSSENGNTLTVHRRSSSEKRRSREIGEALRAIGDDLHNSTLSLHSQSAT